MVNTLNWISAHFWGVFWTCTFLGFFGVWEFFGKGIRGVARWLDQRQERKLGALASSQKLTPRQLEVSEEWPDAVCGCKHHLALHNPQTDKCNGEMPSGSGKDCRCQQYIGPEPLGGIYAPPLIDLNQPKRHPGDATEDVQDG